ncbi:MAG: shikimate dehydrogenase [Methanosarcinaceae archaeon]|nr:shikimate dehydrogenase [Methanosarcinaceae archaeon]
MRTVFGVLGNPIEHSMSPAMHNAAFRELGMECVYHAFRVDTGSLEDAILGAEALGFGGLNITVPLKQEALNIVDADPLASSIGAVNTIDLNNGIHGYNTDGIGAQRALADAGVDIDGQRVLIVGAGGAARAIGFQFHDQGAEVMIVNRTEQRAVELASAIGVRGFGMERLEELIGQADVLINATSAGMYPKTSDSIARREQMHPDLTVFDIVYNPMNTQLLIEAEAAGAIGINGVMMLVYQGAEAFRIWTGVEPPINVMKNAVMEALRS